jgi:hypothetical protein
MNNENEVEIDVPEENKYAGLELPVAVKSQPLAIMKDGTQIMDKAATPQQMRVMEINEALAPAYAKASTLNMTDKEIEALMAPFPDSAVEVRPHDGLIYIPHIHISDRMNRVFKPGQWCMICRRHWLEGNTMYGEYIMLIHGCYVGESVGGHPYQPNNPKVNYSDTLESTAAEALRRIAGKRLSCGWQVWDPGYANTWCNTYRGNQGGKYFKKSAPATAAPPVQKPKTAPAPEPKGSKLDKFIAETQKAGYPTEQLQQFCIDLAWLMPNERLSDLEDRYLPKTVGDFRAFKSCMDNWIAKGDTVQPYDCPIPDPKANVPQSKVPRENVSPAPSVDAQQEPWYGVIVPIPHKGQKRDEYLKNPDTIGSLYELRHDDEDARKRLWGFVTHFEPKGWTKKDGTQMPASSADHEFRAALDQFSEWFEHTHPDEKL